MSDTGSDEIVSTEAAGLSRSQEQVLSTATKRSLPVARCDVHPSELLNMYCGKDKTVCCNVCITLDHKSCGDQVKYLPNAATDVEKSKKYLEVQEELASSLQSFTKSIIKRSKDKEIFIEEKMRARADIDEFRFKVQKKVDMLANNSLKEVDRKYESFMESIAKDIASIECTMDRINAQMTELQKNENECELFTSVIRGLSLTEECKIIEYEISTHIGREQIIVEDDQQIYENLCLKGSIVHFVDKNPTPVSADNVQLLRADQSMTTELADMIPYCDIDDVCCLANGNIVVSDKYNCKLFVLNTSLKVQNEHVIDGIPSYICATSEDEIAVAIKPTYANNGDYSITFFDLKDTVPVESRKLFLTKACRGMTMKDNTLVASYSGRLICFTRSGELRNDIAYDHLKRPGKVAFGSASTYLYIVDDKNGLVCYDHRSGKNMFVDKTLKNMKDMCVDKHNRMFLCDRSAQNIVQVTPHGDTVGTILKKSDGINYVKALCYDQNKDRLIVIMNKCTIAVYIVHK